MIEVRFMLEGTSVKDAVATVFSMLEESKTEVTELHIEHIDH